MTSYEIVRRAIEFQRPERIVQPKINALNEPARNVGVVIFHEDHAVFETPFAAEFVNLLNQRLPSLVLRMRFPRKDKLDWSGFVVEQTLKSRLVAEQQDTALVGSKPARKSNR